MSTQSAQEAASDIPRAHRVSACTFCCCRSLCIYMCVCVSGIIWVFPICFIATRIITSYNCYIYICSKSTQAHSTEESTLHKWVEEYYEMAQSWSLSKWIKPGDEIPSCCVCGACGDNAGSENCVFVPPLYFQHDGHSRTLVGELNAVMNCAMCCSQCTGIVTHCSCVIVIAFLTQ